METDIRVTVTCRSKSRQLRDAKDVFDVFENNVKEATSGDVQYEKLDIRRYFIPISICKKAEMENEGIFVLERMGECIIQIEELPIFATFEDIEAAQQFAQKFEDCKYATAVKLEVSYFTGKNPV